MDVIKRREFGAPHVAALGFGIIGLGIAAAWLWNKAGEGALERATRERLSPRRPGVTVRR